jgi:apolipoprotein N-acyltransferase
MKFSPAIERWVLPVLSGALMASAYPPFNFGQAGWVALVPLLFALDGLVVGAPLRARPGESRAEARSYMEAFRRGYIAGLVFFGATVWWTVHVTLPGMVALVAWLALYFGAGAMWFSTLLSWGRRDVDPAGRNLLTAIAGSAGWVTLEWLRGQLLFGGFPWNFLGVSQHQLVPLIQFAEWTGVYGVSALICFVNFAFFFTTRRYVRQIRNKIPARRPSWEFYLAMLLICAGFVHGLRQIRQQQTRPGPNIALIQGNIPQTLKFEPEQKPMILERYRRMTEIAIGGKPDLIIWPETTMPDPVRYDPESFALVTNLAAMADARLLTGSIDITPYSSPPEAFNAALLIEPDGRLQNIYRKIHLVPFGEYVPLRKVVPFMKWLTPIQESFERGRDFTVFELPVAGWTRFATVICFEDTVPELYRRFVRRDVDFMVNLTNDAWFKQSPAAELHLANAAFRAAETRRPLVRATNNGVTGVVDQFGYVRHRLPPFTEGSLNFQLDLPAAREITFYTRYGDVFVAGCAAVVAVAFGIAGLRRFRLKSPA